MPDPTRSASDPWWQRVVVYQVYPRSFADSDGDGVGDLRGIIDHLDHIAELGVDAVWLSPIYPSPQDDNGYDISDYTDVDDTFGTLADLDELIERLHERGMRLIMDLVVNHTSDEHPWFVASRRSRDSATADWYLWRDPKPGVEPGEPGSEPNNWGSAFSGSAWEWVPERGQFYLHLFSRKQPDLNWENPEVRDAVFAMMNWWLDRGIDGFRMDVVNFICKDPAYPDGVVGATGFGDPMPFTTYGPHIHEHLAEMKRRVFDSRPGAYLPVGEMPGVTPEQARRFTDAEHGQLNMVFQFEHVDLDSEGGKWGAKQIGVLDLKRSLGRWQTALAEHGWNSLYWNNHDQPRVVSRFGNDSSEHWFASATALATVLHLHRGTPYVYQGEELGMTNVPFDDVEDFRDIESVNHYAAAVALGADPEEVLADLRRKSRDNARTPMQWSPTRHAGFTTGTPWISANPNHTWLNAENQRSDPNSVYSYYQRLIALRHAEPVLVHGDFTMLLPDHPSMYAFTRAAEDGAIACYANLTDDRVVVDLPEDSPRWEPLLSNRLPSGPIQDFAPWEARVYRLR